MNSLLKKIVLVLGLIGCNEPFAGKPDFTVDGVDFYINSSSSIVNLGNLPDHFDRVLKLSADYWGHDLNELKGWKVSVQDGNFACGVDIRPQYAGCTDGINHTIIISAKYADALESMCLPHELGHAFTGDTLHLNPKFREFKALWDNIFNIYPNPTSPNDPNAGLCADITQGSDQCASVGLHEPFGFTVDWVQPPGLKEYL